MLSFLSALVAGPRLLGISYLGLIVPPMQHIVNTLIKDIIDK